MGQFIDQSWQFLTKFVVFFAILLGAALKLGINLVKKRKLTLAQHIGVYIITVSFGVIGWQLCLYWGVSDLRMPLVITSFSYFGEHIIEWANRNKEKIFEGTLGAFKKVLKEWLNK